MPFFIYVVDQLYKFPDSVILRTYLISILAYKLNTFFLTFYLLYTAMRTTRVNVTLYVIDITGIMF